VTPLELLYDLTFVVAFGVAGEQLAHLLADPPRNDQDAFGRWVETVGRGEKFTASGIDHRRRSTHHRDRAAISSQLGKTIQG
jgi:hypothetical protein